MQTSDFEIAKFISAGETFFESLTAELESLNIKVENLLCDHLCFRVGTTDEYEVYKKALSPHADLLIEALVNGRPIATYKLHTPYKVQGREISLVELPAPKPGSNYKTGYEHAEFVVTETFSEIREKHPELKFSESLKEINSELTLKLKDEKQVKFHHLSLEKVIELELANEHNPR